MSSQGAFWWIILLSLGSGCYARQIPAFQALAQLRSLKSNSVSDIRKALLQAVPGVTYPTLNRIPKTTFSCGQVYQPGFYADPEAECQLYHRCIGNPDVKYSFLCPNATVFEPFDVTVKSQNPNILQLFNQITLVCDCILTVTAVCPETNTEGDAAVLEDCHGVTMGCTDSSHSELVAGNTFVVSGWYNVDCSKVEAFYSYSNPRLQGYSGKFLDDETTLSSFPGDTDYQQGEEETEASNNSPQFEDSADHFQAAESLMFLKSLTPRVMAVTTAGPDQISTSFSSTTITTMSSVSPGHRNTSRGRSSPGGTVTMSSPAKTSTNALVEAQLNSTGATPSNVNGSQPTKPTETTSMFPNSTKSTATNDTEMSDSSEVWTEAPLPISFFTRTFKVLRPFGPTKTSNFTWPFFPLTPI